MSFEFTPEEPAPTNIVRNRSASDESLNDTRIDYSEAFDVSRIDHEVVRRYKPEFLKKGAESAVFTIPDHPETLAKARLDITAESYLEALEHGTPEAISQELEKMMDEKITELKERNTELQQHFGREHVAHLRAYKVKVPVDEKVIHGVIGMSVTRAPKELWTVVTFQRKVPEIMRGESLSFHSGYSELDDSTSANDDVYARVTSELVSETPTRTQLSHDEFASVQSSDSLLQLLQQSKQDPELREVMSDFVRKAISYSNRTGEILDIAGSNNVSFFKRNDKWTYQLIDVVFPGSKRMIHEAQAVVLDMNHDNELDERDRVVLLNTLNYVRAINGTAQLLGVDSKIPFVKEGIELDPLKARQELQQLH